MTAYQRFPNTNLHPIRPSASEQDAYLPLDPSHDPTCATLTHTLLSQAIDAFALLDRDLRVIQVNPPFARLTHLPPQEHVGRALAVVAPWIDPSALDALGRVLNTGEKLAGLELTARDPITDAGVRWTLRAHPAYGPHGTPIGLVLIASELPPKSRAEEHMEILLAAHDTLSRSLDYETTLTRLAKLFVPDFAEWCVVDLLDEKGEPRAVAIAHPDPQEVALGYEMRKRYPPRYVEKGGIMKVLATGKSALFPEIPDSLLIARAHSAEHLRNLRSAGMRSALIVPLTAHGRILGAITLISARDSHRYDPLDQSLIERIASRAALAIDNALLYAAERREREAAERSADRITRLQALTQALSEALTSEQVADVVVRAGVAALGACAGLLYTRNRRDDTLELVGALGYDQSVLDAYRVIPMTAPVPIAEAVRKAQILLFNTPTEFKRYPAIKAALEIGVQQHRRSAWAALPLLLRGEEQGALAFGFEGARTLEEERDFLLTMARLCAQALERARLYEHERQTRKAREDFLSIVSHDLRNPLGVLGMSAALIARGAPPGDAGDSARRHAAMMQRAVDKMNSLIRDLLDAGALEAGRLRLSIAEHDAIEIVDEASSRLAPLGKTTSVHIVKEHGRERCALPCDRDRVLLVLSDLIGNALKHTPRGGRVRLAVEARESEVIFSVSDAGPFIPEDLRAHLFERFWAGQNKVRPGTGLSLYIAQGIVQAHGGRIWVESAPNAGSTFFFAIPAKAA